MRGLKPVCIFVVLFSFIGYSLPVRAQRPRSSTKRHLPENTDVGHVLLYTMQPPSTAFDTSPFPVGTAVPTTRAVYSLSGFDTFRGSNESLQEFNRLISAFQLSIGKERALSLAQLFLDTSVGESGEVALDEGGLGLRLAVQNYYFAAYGEVWSALDAYAVWWEGFRRSSPILSPTITLGENGDYRIALKKLVLRGGQHPQVQNWDLGISRDGQVGVWSMQLIFPVHPGWMFYDKSLRSSNN